MNWLNLVNFIPLVIMGIQQIHKDAAGATKKQLALESLGLAVGVADVVLPEKKATIDAVGAMIDSFVNMFHATNAPGFGANATPAS